MYKITKLFLGFLITTQAAMVVQPRSPYVMEEPMPVDNFAFVENELLSSSRYTQPDNFSEEDYQTFFDDYSLAFTSQELSTMGYTLGLENDQFRLYVEQDSFSIILEDKDSGYMYSSRPEFQGFSGTREDNTANRNQMNSGLWIESLRTTNVSSSAIKVESLYTLADVSYANNGSQDLEAIDLTRPYVLEANSYDTDRVSVQFVSSENNVLTYAFDIKVYGFIFTVQLGLNDVGFTVMFDPTHVEENNENFRLTGLQFFPYFGSVREDKFPSYMVIPDGNGALVRTNTDYDTAFQADYYGSDPGYGKTSIAQLSMPVYGLMHAVNEKGFWTEIESGAEHSTLLANFWGRSTRYHRITNRFNLRRVYRNIINRAGDGSDVIPSERVETPYEASYRVLNDDRANYVGMAKAYREQLIEKMNLSPSLPEAMPIHLNMLMAEQEPTFFGTSPVIMTTARQVREISEQLREQGVAQQTVGITGWSTDGLTYYAPYRTRYTDRSGLVSVIQDLQEAGAETYLHQGYLTSTSLSRRVDYNRDVARNYSKLKMSRTFNRFDSDQVSFYYLYPDQSLTMMKNDVSSFESLGVDGLLMQDFGSLLTSYYDGERRSRTHTLGILQEMASLMDGLALSRPNAYLLAYAKHYMDLPITNAQLDLYTDLIPFVSYTLRGLIPTYTPYLNFNALGKDRLLQMIDYGVYPSYLLTAAESTRLRYTYSNRYFTTAFSDFEEDIVNVYDYLAPFYEALKDVEITSRTMLTIGVSRVSLSDGSELIVNYRSQPYTYLEETIPAQEARILG